MKITGAQYNNYDVHCYLKVVNAYTHGSTRTAPEKNPRTDRRTDKAFQCTLNYFVVVGIKTKTILTLTSNLSPSKL